MCALFVSYCVLCGVSLFLLFVCVVLARFACDVWRDGVWFVFYCCFCLCALLLIRLCDACMIYCVLVYGLLFVLFCRYACGFKFV